MIRHADWIVDVGPEAASAAADPLQRATGGHCRGRGFPHAAVSGRRFASASKRAASRAGGSLCAASRAKLRESTSSSLGVLTSVTGVSGSGKSSLISQALVELVLAHPATNNPPRNRSRRSRAPRGAHPRRRDQRARGSSAWCRSTRSRSAARRAELATYTGLFDHVRKLFAATSSRALAATSRGASRSTSREAAVNLRREAWSWSSSCSCPASTRPARRATARGTREDPRGRAARQEHGQVLAMTVDDATEFSRRAGGATGR